MRGINREISKQPQGEQPGNINVNMENMDNEMVELWKNMMAFFGPIEYNVLEKHPWVFPIGLWVFLSCKIVKKRYQPQQPFHCHSDRG